MMYHQLLETLTTGGFTFGFELEALYELKSSDNFDEDIDTKEDFISDNILPIIEKNGIFGKIVSDSSIMPSNTKQIPFEFVSDPLSFNSKNLQKLFKTLSSLKSNNIKTNSSCGFHIHIKYPGLSKNDIRWILACISTNQQFRNITTNFKDYDFYDFAFASTDIYHDLNTAIEENDDRYIIELLDESKYQILRIHPQGTLEWRGPRNFLNEGNSNVIHDFIIHLYGYIRMIIKCLNQISVGDYSKKEFYSLFNNDKPPLNQKQIDFLKNYSGKEKEIAKRLVLEYPNILNDKFKSPPKIYIDPNGDNDIFKIEGDVIDGVWDFPYKVIFMKGDFANSVFKNGYFNGNWIPSSTWVNGITGSGYTYDGEKVPNDVTPKTWEKYLGSQ